MKEDLMLINYMMKLLHHQSQTHNLYYQQLVSQCTCMKPAVNKLKNLKLLIESITI